MQCGGRQRGLPFVGGRTREVKAVGAGAGTEARDRARDERRDDGGDANGARLAGHVGLAGRLLRGQRVQFGLDVEDVLLETLDGVVVGAGGAGGQRRRQGLRRTSPEPQMARWAVGRPGGLRMAARQRPVSPLQPPIWLYCAACRSSACKNTCAKSALSKDSRHCTVQVGVPRGIRAVRATCAWPGCFNVR